MNTCKSRRNNVAHEPPTAVRFLFGRQKIKIFVFVSLTNRGDGQFMLIFFYRVKRVHFIQRRVEELILIL